MKTKKFRNPIVIGLVIGVIFTVSFQQCDTPETQSYNKTPNQTERKLASEELAQVRAVPAGMDPREFSVLLYRRLVGVAVSYDSNIISTMATKVQAGDIEGASVDAINDNTETFLAVTVKNLAAKKLKRSRAEPLNDYIATIIGVVKDQRDARELLLGDYIYRSNSTLASIPSNPVTDFLNSNAHYVGLENTINREAALGTRAVTYSNTLVRQRQSIRDTQGAAIDHPEPAGLITTRAFMIDTVNAGTNRAPIEKSLLQFTCASSEDWKDISAPDAYVGYDIDRFPDGVNSNYTGNCKGCHSVLDSLRPAFAKYDLSLTTPFVKHADIFGDANRLTTAPFAGVGDANFAASRATAGGPAIRIAQKMNHNVVYPYGHRVLDEKFDNQGIYGTNADWFGWNGPTRGEGIQDYARMIASSDAFSRCLVMNVYESVCERPYSEISRGDADDLAFQFRSSGYNIRKIFEKVASVPSCIGWE
jgi:hypothetical protein